MTSGSSALRMDTLDEPSFGVRPMPVHRALRHAQDFRDFEIGAAAEELERDDPGLDRIVRFETLQGVVELEDLLVGRGADEVELVVFDPKQIAPTLATRL